MITLRQLSVLLVPLALAACGGGGGGGRGIALRPGTSGNYTAPGPAGDPWGPYVREAAARFAVPEIWVRAVIRQESGGHEYLHGELVTSGAGAMGLMQLMPATYAELAARYGSPGFLAAYNAGPGRMDDYLAGRSSLPDETVAYLDSVAPTLVGSGAMSGPLVAYAGGGGVTPATSPAPVEVAEAEPRTVAGSRLWSGAPAVPAPEPAPVPAPAPAFVAASALPPPPPARRGGFGLIGSAYADTRPMDTHDARWGVQVGAFSDASQARQVADSARQIASAQLSQAQTVVGSVTHTDGRTCFRARLIGVTEPAADSACGVLSARQWPCLAVPPGG